MRFNLKCGAIAFLGLVISGCDYTEEELIQQLYEKDARFNQQVKATQSATSNRVASFRSRYESDFAQQASQFSAMKQQLLSSYNKEDADIRRWLKAGDLQNYYQGLVPTYGQKGRFLSPSGTFQGLTLQEGKAVLHFRNNHSYKCKPSVRVTFYDLHLEKLGDVVETWFWTSLSPSETADEYNALPFLQTPFYFKVEHLK